METRVGELTSSEFIGVILAAVCVLIVILLVIVFVVKVRLWRRTDRKGPAILSSDFEAENAGVVSAVHSITNYDVIIGPKYIGVAHDTSPLMEKFCSC